MLKFINFSARVPKIPDPLYLFPAGQNFEKIFNFPKLKNPRPMRDFSRLKNFFFRKNFFPARKVRLSRTLRAGTKSMILADLRKFSNFLKNPDDCSTNRPKIFQKIFKKFDETYPKILAFWPKFLRPAQTRYHRDQKITARSGLGHITQTSIAFLLRIYAQQKDPKNPQNLSKFWPFLAKICSNQP